MSSDFQTHSTILPKIRLTLLAGACFVSLGGAATFAQTVPLHVNDVQTPSLSELKNKGGMNENVEAVPNGKSGDDAKLIGSKKAKAGQNGQSGQGSGVRDTRSYSENNKNIFLVGSKGGAGGKGGSVGRGRPGNGAAAGAGGDGGFVSVDSGGDLTVKNASGIVVFSEGGNGGKGGSASAVWDNVTAGDGGDGGAGGSVGVTNNGMITASGNQALGIFAQSSGGNGGKAGEADGERANATAGKSGYGGNGGSVTVTNKGNITTNGVGSDAIHGLSNGGNGADAAQAKSFRTAKNGVAGHGGDGSTVTIINEADVITKDDQSNGLVGKSVGGKGGNGNNVTPLGSVDTTTPAGGNGGDGGDVSITNTGSLTINNGHAIYAESSGGAGGTSGSSVAAASQVKSGTGGNGGDGGKVTVTNSGTGSVETLNANSSAIVAVSKGGQGGSANYAGSTRQATVGAGGNGGNAGQVTIKNAQSVTTKGVSSDGLIASSTGGNGGNGGWAVSGTDASSGHGGKGGHAGKVTIENNGIIETTGENSSAIIAVSTGGTGGNSGFAGAVGVSKSGNGGQGGHGGETSVTNKNSVDTKGKNSAGIVASSQGGAGGNGGWSFAGGKASSGNGGAGGKSDRVTVDNSGDLTTRGESSSAIIASSAGGAGGNGGFSIGVGVVTSGNGGQGGQAGEVILNNQGTLSTEGAFSGGIVATSEGGKGGNSGWSGGAGSTTSGSGGDGGAAGKVTIDNHGEMSTAGDQSNVITAVSAGGAGGNAGFSASGGAASSGSGGNGGAGGAVTTNNSGDIVTKGASSAALVAASSGGKGGNAGWSFAGGKASSGNGGSGGKSDRVTVDNSGDLTTRGENSSAIIASSAGGVGGNGGFSIGLGVSSSGNGGQGGQAEEVIVNNQGTLSTEGAFSGAIVAASAGGGGGNSGWSIGGGNTTSGSGGDGGAAGKVTIDNQGEMTTTGDQSNAITAVSAGGNGGNAGFSAGGGLATSGSGGKGGDGEALDINNSADLTTNGASSSALVATSRGGHGGNAGWSAAIGKGTTGKGGAGGAGGGVDATNSGNITTKGEKSSGVIATSEGGNGGSGGMAIGAYASAQGGGTGGKSGRVTATNSGKISTEQSESHGMVALSQGGKGGNGGLQASIASNGADGGLGGQGDAVSVTNNGAIETGIAAKDDSAKVTGSAGIIAQSVGGDGGNSGSNFTGLPIVTGSYGGTAGAGGAGGSVDVITGAGSSITTYGDESAGIIAQSGGGKGGNGELTVSVAAGPGAIAGALGAVGGKGGAADSVNVETAGTITTHGHNSVGVQANSIGGEGGKGGLIITGAASTTASVAVSVAREGGDGGNGGTVDVKNSAQISTRGNHSSAISALSAGGKGGEGGWAGDLTISAVVGGSVSVAGNGGSGGHGGDTNIQNSGALTTEGDGSAGILAQSLGGEGGHGGKAMAVALGGGGSLSASVGGKGGAGGNAGKVDINNEGAIATKGAGSSAIIAHSTGGKGGQGEGNGTGAFTSTGTLTVAGGNDGGAGGDADTVTVVNQGNLYTQGDGAAGIEALSEGGAGGAGGNAISIATAGGGAISGAWGGKGGKGGKGSDVTINNSGFIRTDGANASAINAQSKGGQGGEAGLAGAAGFAVFPSQPTVAASVGYGQVGGDGGKAGVVTVNSGPALGELGDDDFSIITLGEGSRGILAQSAGGNGDNGGMAGALSGSLGTVTFDSGAAIGGNGGKGADAGKVTVTSTDHIVTFGNQASGIKALSQGGNGGNGGGAGIAALEASASNKSYGAMAAIGGSGGHGGAGADSNVKFDGLIVTQGDQSNGIHAGSSGGKGGDAGNTLSVGIGFTPEALNLIGGVGGAAGNGGQAGDVRVDFKGQILTEGNSSAGILAESLGGNGDTGSFNGAGAIGHIGATNGAVTWARVAGDGGEAGKVRVETDGEIFTTGDSSDALLARSLGGQGGAAEQSIAATIGGQSSTANTNVSVAVAGNGGNGANGGAASVDNKALIVTTGADARGIAAQSIGGAGGAGGEAIAGAANLAGMNSGQSRIGLISIAGNGGEGAVGGSIDVINAGTVITKGNNSIAIQAHSLGGAGGKGGDASVAHALLKVEIPNVDASPSASTYQLLVGGAGGKGGDADTVNLTNQGLIYTQGKGSAGIDAQSIGGAGGDGGSSKLWFTAEDIPFDPIKELIDKEAGNWIIGTGGTGGVGGDGADVAVSNEGLIITEADDAAGIIARSQGGAGGNSGAGGLADGSLGIGGGALTELVRATGENTEAQSEILDKIFAWADDVGTGGDTGDVSLTNGIAGDMQIGAILTSGDRSAALIAETIGGNGGNGGDASGKLAFGGDGGRAGHAGQVDVTNHAYLITKGDASAGIIARSKGGAGGQAGNASLGGEKQDANLTFGGRGGAGGDAGQVDVDNQGAIFTDGDGSQGILAQSFGGEGGNAGTGTSKYVGLGGGVADKIASENLDWFGSNGAGGDGDDVTVTNGTAGDNEAGVIVTKGNQSSAIAAHSAGGQGGAGGAANGILSLGGDGGVAGDAGKIDIANHGTLVTKGNQSAGIEALSRGGTGGAGGSTATDADVTTVLAVAGRGGDGGDAGQVVINNQGAIFTEGDSSQGILAQSLGGEGGNAGTGTSKYVGLGGGVADKIASENLDWFGSNGTGGDGDDVTVTNGTAGDKDAGIIVTKGNHSSAIDAHSAGGQGGAGGAANGLLSLGGDGGVAGDAGKIDIVNHAILATEGGHAAGIVARSSGGTGGAGGSVGTADAREGFVALSGRGGAGGSASNVTVKNNGVIVTSGNGSNGILAQSVGGDGGKAGDSHSKLIAAGGGIFDGLINNKADWYGRTGSGGNAGDVSVTNGDAQDQTTGTIISNGDNAGLIVAQSSGGNGGAGGDASGLVKFDVPGTADDEAALGISVAGDGGNVGKAGKVEVTNYATLMSEGKNSAGIIAQSVGGRGGNGGNANATTAETDKKIFVDATAGAGGLAGSGGHAGQVTVTNSGDIYTFGGGSAGIIAEATGGAGGIAGKAEAGLALGGGAFSDLTKAPNGGGGNSGTVHVVNGAAGQAENSLIYTAGHDATAIIARSTGGNGSAGGAVSGTFAFDANGGAGGHAGAVTVENYADLITKGDRSGGILAQSAGGNGGSATDGNQSDLYEAVDGITGNAGTVSITNSGLIVTGGKDAAAIAALSEGVGAGAVSVNNSGDIITSGVLSAGIAAQSLGQDNAGAVSIANKGNIVTTSAGSNALIVRSVVEKGAQSALRTAPQKAGAAKALKTASGGQAGNVTIDQAGDLFAVGNGSSAIYAQSTGITNGNIDIAIHAESLLVGGSLGGAGITMIDGTQNSLTNDGTITALGDQIGYIPGSDGLLYGAGWIDGMAMQGTTGDATIINTGLVVGNVDMGSGTSTFTNEKGGWMVAGAQIGLGGQQDSLFTNAGVFTSGGINNAQSTVIDGNFDQTETGHYLVDLDFSGGTADSAQRSATSASGKADRLDITGKANLGGRLPVSVSNAGHAKSGQSDFVIVHAEGGVQDDGMELAAPNTAVADFTLTYTDNETVLGAYIDYATKGLTENGIAVGDTINNIQFDQISPAFRPLASAIFAQADIASLQRTYDLISGEGTAGTQQAYFSDTNAYIGAISQQTNLWSNPYRLGAGKTDRQCTLKKNVCVESLWRGWYSGFGSDTSLQGDPYVVGSDNLNSHSKGMAAGLDYELTKDLLLGFSVGISKADFKVNDRMTAGNIETGRTALYGAYRQDNFYVDGLVGVDWFNASVNRSAMILPTASNAGFSDNLQNDFSGYGINARVETGYRMDLGGVQFTPFAALQLSSFHMNSSTERAYITNGDLALYYKRRSINSVPLSLGAQLDTRIELGENAYFSPYIRAAWVHEFSNKRSIEAGFTAAPGYEFTVNGAAQSRNSAQIEAGFNMQIETGLSLYGKVTGNLSGSNHNVSGSGGLRLRW